MEIQKKLTEKLGIDSLKAELLQLLMFGDKKDSELVNQIESILHREKSLIREELRDCTHECYDCVQVRRHQENKLKLDEIIKILKS